MNVLEQYPECLDPIACMGMCADVSRYHVEQNHGSEVVYLQGYLGNHNTRNWKGIHPSQFHHTIVRQGDKYFDWTARQFEKEASVPLIMNEEELASRWSFIERRETVSQKSDHTST